METVVSPNINVVKRGVLIGSVTKFGSRSNGISTIKNLSQSLTLLKAITRIVGILQMVFINSITTTHWVRVRAWGRLGLGLGGG
jgi:hypothetical protein